VQGRTSEVLQGLAAEYHLFTWSARSNTPGCPPTRCTCAATTRSRSGAERDGHQRLVQRAAALLDTVTAGIVGL
jgi:hypothetical protein